jgi:hypothetical protein
MPVPTPEERERRRQALQGKRAPAIPITPPPAGRREQIKERQVASELQEAEIEAEGAEDELFSAILAEVKRENMLLTPAAAREEAQKRLAERRGGPYYVGGFKPVEFTSAVAPLTTLPLGVAGALPAARPQEFPVAPDKPITMAEALAPQTRAGVRAVDKVKREQTASIFDDRAFNESIKALPDADKREQLDAYEAYKAAFKKIRDLNPLETTGVTDEDIKRDLDRQLKALGTGDVKTFVDDPANRMGYSGDPLARALQKQVTTGAPVPVLEPGQTEFVSTLDRLKRSRATSTAAAEAEERLKKQGVPIMKKVRKPTGERGPGGRPIFEEVDVPTGQYRPATPEDIKRARENVAAFTDKEMPKPLYAETGKIDQFLSANEKASKGGIIFQKEFPTGATVESPVSWFVRSALAVPNALVGAASELTPEAIEKRERAGRPALYKDASAAIYNVAGSRGLMGEIGDLYEYAPESWTIGEFFTLPAAPALGFQGSDPIFVGKPLKQYTTYAKAAGFAGDLIGFDLGLIGAATTGARGAVAGARAARAAGEGAGAIAGAAARTGYKSASKEFLDTIGMATAAKKVNLGDVRLQFGTSLGDSMRAADVYKQALQSGKTEAQALSDAAAVAPKSKFVADMQKSPITDVMKIETYFKDADDEWTAFQKVTRGIDTAKSGGAVADFADVVRPYIAAAARNTPELKPLFQAAAKDLTAVQTRVKLSEVINKVNTLPPDAQARFYDTVRDTASAELGFTAIDRAIGAADPGRFTIRLTPNTFTSDDTVDSILEGVRQTGEYKLAQRITSRGTVDGKYVITGGEKQGLGGVVQRQVASGTFPRSQASRILLSIDKGAVSGDDLRLIMNSVIDTVAEQTGRAFKERALATGGKAPVPAGPVREAPIPSTRPLTEGQTAGIFNTAWTKAADAFDNLTKGASDMSRYLSRAQIRVLEEGKRKMSALKSIMKSELDELTKQGITDPFERAARLSGDASNSQTWRNIAKSSIFGRADTSTIDLFLGRFQYSDPFQFLNATGRKQLEDLIDAASSKGVLDEVELNNFISQARQITENVDNLLPSFVAGAGKIFDLNQKPIEVLASSWARRTVDDIANDTIARVLDFEPDTIGRVTEGLRVVLKDMRTADGTLVADLPINAVVAEMMLGTFNASARLEDSANPLIKQFIDTIGGGKRVLAALAPDIIRDANETAALLMAKYGNRSTIEAEAALLLSGKGTIAELGGPLGSLLGKAVRDEFGKSPDFEGFTKELGILAEMASDGKSGALAASNAMSSLIDTYNSVFYNLILSYSLRYHGTNFITGPFIGYTTTGRVAIPDLYSAAKVIGRGENAAARSEVIATDKITGVPVTLGELYDRSVKSGFFKSQIRGQIDPRFLDDARSLGLATVGRGGKAKIALLNKLSFPSEVANASDTVWRMSYVIDAINSGKSVDEALDVGRRSLYDYGAASPAERKYIAKNVLFWNYFRNSVLETTRQAFTSPSRLARQFRLVQDYSKLKVGEDKWNEMRWYTPYDAGVARLVLDYAPQAGREGKITMLPNMPWYDAVYIMSGLLTTPGDILRGPADPVTGKRDYGTGYIFNKLGPNGQAALSFITGADMLADIKLKKNEAPIPHVAMMDEMGVLPIYTNFFNIKKIPAEPGQNGWNGYVYTMEPEDFERYKTFIKKSKLIGLQRPVDDYAKWFATWDLPGTATDVVTGPSNAQLTLGETDDIVDVLKGEAEALGFTTETRAGVPAEAEVRAAQLRTRQAEQDVKEVTPTPEEVRAGRKR